MVYTESEICRRLSCSRGWIHKMKKQVKCLNYLIGVKGFERLFSAMDYELISNVYILRKLNFSIQDINLILAGDEFYDDEIIYRVGVLKDILKTY